MSYLVTSAVRRLVLALQSQTGAAMVGETQGGAGATTRTVQDRLRDSVSFFDLMTAAQIADVRARTRLLNVTLPVQLAISAAVAMGCQVRANAGDYLLDTKITATFPLGMSLKGDGSGVTNLVWTNGATGGGGLDLTYTDMAYPIQVEGVCVQTLADTTAGSAGVKITGPTLLTSLYLGAQVRDVTARGSDFNSQGWDYGIEFKNVWYAVFERITVTGKNALVLPFAATAGVRLNDVNVCFGRIFNITHVTHGVQQAGTSGPTSGDGFNLSHFEIVGVENGISLISTAVNAATSIGPGHINSYSRGINAFARGQLQIHGILFYKTHLSSSNYVAMNLPSCSTLRVHDNLVMGDAAATGDTVGMVIGDTIGDFNDIHNNRFANFSGPNRWGIVVGAGAGNNDVYNNQGDATIQEIVRIDPAAEKNNRFRNNEPDLASLQVVDVNSATPSVGNALTEEWSTSNTIATTITNLIDGYPGQVVMLLINDPLTIIGHGANINLQGGANFGPGNGGHITIRKDLVGGLWREINRRTP